MKKTMKVFVGMLVIVMSLTGTMATAESMHIERILESPFLTLKLDADVILPEPGKQMVVYETDHINIDAESWARMFSHDITFSGEMVERPNGDYLLRHGDMLARYFHNEARVYARYSSKEVSTWWDYAQKGIQAVGLSTTPQQAADISQEWIDKLNDILGWDGYVLSACYSMPAAVEGVMPGQEMDNAASDESMDATGYYIVEYVRSLDGYHVAYDKSPYVDETLAFLDGDQIQIYIDDDGIFRVDGFCRSYTAKQTETIQIPIEEAIGILEDNMDYVVCYPDETPCIINEIQLCYRLVQTLPTSDSDACVRTVARPVWRFASRINRNESDVFFIYIDAITGEVIP